MNLGRQMNYGQFGIPVNVFESELSTPRPRGIIAEAGLRSGLSLALLV